jgi:hypothetical protein
MKQEVTELITEEIMGQYEIIRKVGQCNMVDYRCVNNEAWLHGFYELADLNGEEYRILLKNYGKLMKHYQIGDE